MDKITINVNGLSFDMLRVEGGHFIMGATIEQHGEEWDNETPPHEVMLESYYLGETVVTQSLWQAVMEETGDVVANMPLTGKSWKECQTFISKLNKLTGRRFRLPTEAEWEYAARGGSMTKGFKYAGSNNLDAVAWFDMNSGGTNHPVKRKQPNELGLYDMSGNIWEWCNDWYSEYERNEDDEVEKIVYQNPKGPARGSQKVVRGASSSHYARSCRVSCRMGLEPEWKNYASTGFRLSIDERQALMPPGSNSLEENPVESSGYQGHGKSNPFGEAGSTNASFFNGQVDTSVNDNAKRGDNGKGHYWGTKGGKNSQGKKNKLWLWLTVAGIALIVVLVLAFGGGKEDEPNPPQPVKNETPVKKPSTKKNNVKDDIAKNINSAVQLFNDNQLTQMKYITYEPMIDNLSQGWQNLLAAERDNNSIMSSDPNTYDSNIRQIKEWKQAYLNHVESVYNDEKANLNGLMKDPSKNKDAIEQGETRIRQIEQFAGIDELSE